MSDTLRTRVERVVREMENELLRLNERARAVDYALLQIRPLLREEEVDNVDDDDEEDRRSDVQESPSQTQIEVGGYKWRLSSNKQGAVETWYSDNEEQEMAVSGCLRKGKKYWCGELWDAGIKNMQLKAETLEDAMQELIDFMNKVSAKKV